MGNSSTLRITVSDYFPRDAIGLFIAGIAERVRQKGVPCEIYSERHGEGLHVAGAYGDCLNSLKPGDILLHHLSGGEPELRSLLGAPCRKAIFYHNITPPEYFREISDFAADLLERGIADLTLLRNADMVFANSSWTLRDVAPHLNPAAPAGSLPPINPERLKMLAKISENSPRPLKVPYIVSVGRLVPHKNLAGTLELFQQLSLLLPDLHYVMVGNGPDAHLDYLKKFVNENALAPRVHFIQDANDDEMAEWLRNAELLLSMSHHEGFCVPLVEAMACNVPVAISRQPAMLETVGDAAIFLGSDVPANAKRLEQVLCDEDARRELQNLGMRRLNNLIQDYENSEFWECLLN